MSYVVFTDEEIKELFTYHSPSPAGAERHSFLSEAFIAVAKAVQDNCPDGPDKTTAIRKLRESKMTASAAIALDPKYR